MQRDKAEGRERKKCKELTWFSLTAYVHNKMLLMTRYLVLSSVFYNKPIEGYL